MARSKHNCLNPSLSNCLALSEMRTLEIPNLTDDVLPYKIPSVPFYDLGESLRLYPLHEVINGND